MTDRSTAKVATHDQAPYARHKNKSCWFSSPISLFTSYELIVVVSPHELIHGLAERIPRASEPQPSNLDRWQHRLQRWSVDAAAAQDWLVLVRLTHDDASFLACMIAQQFSPQPALVPIAGPDADQIDKPFVADLVVGRDLMIATSFGSATSNASRAGGPAVAGYGVAGLGTESAFVIASMSVRATLGSLIRRRSTTDDGTKPKRRGRQSFCETLNAVESNPGLPKRCSKAFLVGTFGPDFPVDTSAMAIAVFHLTPLSYGVICARTGPPRLVAGAAGFGRACASAAIVPDLLSFGVSPVCVSARAVTFLNRASMLVHNRTEPAIRGRVAALRLALMTGGTPIGSVRAGRPVSGPPQDRRQPWSGSGSGGTECAGAR